MNRIKVVRIYNGDITILYTVTPHSEIVRLTQIISESKYLRKSKVHKEINKLVEAGKMPSIETIGECTLREDCKKMISQHKTKITKKLNKQKDEKGNKNTKS
jgi:hypothetical protein